MNLKKNIVAERCRIPIMVSLSPRDLKVTARFIAKANNSKYFEPFVHYCVLNRIYLFEIL